MAKEKRESDLTPVEVMKVGTARMEEFHPWALAIAKTILDQNMTKSWIDKNPAEYSKLEYAIANNLVHANTNRVAALESLCGEMYQIMGTMGNLVPLTVMEKLQMAMNGKDHFADIMLLPYRMPEWASYALDKARGYDGID